MAAPGKLEIEAGPVGFIDAGGSVQYAPRLVANYGLAGATEVVLEGVQHVALGRAAGPRFSVSGLQVSLKRVLRAGILQENAGPSFAAECGALLPGVHDEEGFGVVCGAIVSLRSGPLLMHANASIALERTGKLAVEPAVIVEGPTPGPVRPVAEALFSREWGAGNTATLLAGLIWRVREELTIDGAVRGGRSEGTTLLEMRAGFTWAF